MRKVFKDYETGMYGLGVFDDRTGEMLRGSPIKWFKTKKGAELSLKRIMRGR